jgi:hypothetical protein
VGKGRFGATAVVLLVVLLLSGCGGGGDESSSTLTKTEFVSEGDKICKAATQLRIATLKKEFAKRELEGGTPYTNAEKEELVTDLLLPIFRDMHQELMELEAPEDPKASEIMDGYKQTIVTLEKRPARSFLTNPFLQVDKKAAAYGFKDCGQI